MSNDPKHSKLSNQFGGVTGPSDAELSNIESGASSASEGGSYYTPENIESMRASFANIDPNYAAVRNARAGRGTGGIVPSSIGGRIETGGGLDDVSGSYSDTKASADTIFGNVSNTVLGESSKLNKTGEMSAGEGSASPAYSDESTGRGRRFSGAGMGGWDVDAGKRASSFDTMRPRSGDEARARAQGIMLLKTAGPTCNHPTCQGMRAKGYEMLGGAGESRLAAATPWEATGTPHPSVRKDNPVPPMVVREESKGKEKLVGRFAPLTEKGSSTDMGDFTPDYKNPVKTPIYEPMDSKDPKWESMLQHYKAQVKAGESPLFHPEDYLEHQHAPGEENYKLPWE